MQEAKRAEEAFERTSGEAAAWGVARDEDVARG
jgi:hypothetical protein